MLGRLALFGLGCLAFSCSSPRVVKTALEGDLPSLKRDVAAARERGELDEGTVRELALAVLRREISSLHGAYAPALLASFSGCAAHVVPALEGRARTGGEVAAAADRLLLGLGELSPEEAMKRFATSEEGAFRAVAAQAAVGSEYGQLRRRLLLDPDPEVRAGALRATLAESDPKDTELLFEASRVDPDPLCRSLALRGLGQLGTLRAVRVLRDRFAQADETTQMSIAEAWSLPKAMAAGGEAMLVWLAETGDGLPALSAAAGLLRHAGKQRELGIAVLLRLIQQGTTSERRVAIALAPLDSAPIVVALWRASAKDTELALRASALSRLLSAPAEVAQAKQKLKQLLGGKDEAAFIAEQALARAGDESVALALNQHLAKDGVEHRRLAALALLHLNRYSEVATALADEHPRVRASIACEIVQR